MNKPLKIGIAGGRGLSTLLGFQSMDGVEIAALCDLDEALLQQKSKEHGIPKTYRVFDDMLESDIDAVVIATPMQCHVPQAIAALEAGKHVLSEVTAGVTMDELWWLKEAVEKSGKTYMYAENYCYMPYCQQIREMARQGLFGEVYYAECEYLHNVRSLMTYPNGKTSWRSYYMPYCQQIREMARQGLFGEVYYAECEYLHNVRSLMTYPNGKTSWRSYWQLGKRGCFYPTHSLGPVMQWFEGERIRSISCFSAGHHNGLRQDDTSVTMCQTDSGKLIKLRVDCVSPRPHNMTGYQLQGTRGAFESARSPEGKHLVWFDTLGEDTDHSHWRDLADFPDYLRYQLQGTRGAFESARSPEGKHLVWFDTLGEDTDHSHWRDLADFPDYLPQRYRTATDEQNQAGHGGGDFFLVEDFVRAIRTGEKPDIDVYQACEWTAVGLLSELSVMNGGRTLDVPDFRKNGVDNQIIRL